MEEAGGDVRYLTRDDILAANWDQINTSGGFMSLAGKPRNDNSLRYLVGSLKDDWCGQSLYPTLWEKAAAYAYNIITRHVFFDGNKRTGTACSIQFLELNGWRLSDRVAHDEIVDLAVGVTMSRIDFKEAAEWFRERAEPEP